ncbi:MAG: YlxR family protein [Clostridiales bacterium]|nr:YlxR family protein [Clostridiales bacterium]
MQQKKVPLRKCTGCGEMKPKRELIRVVKSPEGEISLDLNGRAAGRGAYVCPDAACLRAARKAKRFERAFECRIPDEVFEKMEEKLAGNEG